MNEIKIHGVTVATVGKNFGHIGVVTNDRREVVAQTEVVPYGMRGTALVKGEELAAKHGYPAGVSYWSVYEQVWRHVTHRQQVPDREIAAMPEHDRQIIARLG